MRKRRTFSREFKREAATMVLDQRAGAGQIHTKKSYRALGIGRDQSIKLIDRLRVHETVERL